MRGPALPTFVPPMNKRWLLVLLQTAVTVGLLAIFFHDAAFRREAGEALRHARPGWLALGVLIAGVENLIGAVRWRIFLRMLDVGVPFWKSVQVCLVALFCNTFLLGAAGGDLVRAAYLVQRGANKADALLSIIMDRVCGLGGLIFYTLLLGAWNYPWLTASPRAALLFHLVIAYQMGCVLLVGASLYAAARGLTERLPPWVPFPGFVRDMGSGYAKMARHWRGSLRALSLSLVMVPGLFGVFFCAARAFGASISFAHLATIMPIADVISSLPISVGGMGVREWTFVGLLGALAGTSAAVATSISLAGYLVNSSWGLVGAAMLPFYKGIVRPARRAGPPGPG